MIAGICALTLICVSQFHAFLQYYHQHTVPVVFLDTVRDHTLGPIKENVFVKYVIQCLETIICTLSLSKFRYESLF